MSNRDRRRSGIRALHLEGSQIMLYTLAVGLLFLWMIAVILSFTLGGLIHIVLVVAVVLTLVRFFSGRRI
jgi:hypothetical protein